VQVVLVVLPLLLGAAVPGANLGTWLNVAVAAVGAFTVYYVPDARWKGTKIVVAVVFAALQVALSASSDGAISHAEWNAVVLAGVSVVGALVFPNRPVDGGGATGDVTEDL
jgi:hypothetical protein